jgi:uncharacterized protein YecE (DUF72 family)
MDILIGTSGWSYDDWVGNFYPEQLRNAKNQWLGFYGQYLNTVEINSTFYRVPEEFIINNWIKKGKRLDIFEFSLKLPQTITHEAIIKESSEKAAQLAKSFEFKCIRPLATNNLLGSVLIQLSPYFRRFNTKTNIDNLPKLRHLFDIINCAEYNYSIEFRHSSWLNLSKDDLSNDTLELLKEFNIANCILDGPGFPVTKTDTANHGYIRFHGRNQDLWFKSNRNKDRDITDEKSYVDTRMNRYDYLYTAAELKSWLPRIKQQENSKGTKTRIYFNNHPNAQAVKNAFMLMDMMGMPRKVVEVKDKKQFKLDSF